MAKLTLLSMTQKILASMDSDDVTDIFDTEESVQVADIIEDTYYHLLSELDPPSMKDTCQLVDATDVNFPTTMTLPTSVTEISEIKYEITEFGDANRSFRDLKYLEPLDFIDKLLNRSSGDTNIVESTAPSGTPLFLYKDRYPSFWTTFDDESIVADAYFDAVEELLLGTKATVLCTKSPSFTQSDSFVPDFPEKAFPLLLAESKRACHMYLKQQDSPIDAKRALQANSTFKNKKWTAHDTKKKIKFGRK